MSDVDRIFINDNPLLEIKNDKSNRQSNVRRPFNNSNIHSDYREGNVIQLASVAI